ncbi:DNA-binding bromodomain-containing protein [Striga hermonthica]|uniref:DNA-binding bromodomain-containing protein n=1 Tax=Striga hermonthica TaxID=68872 RepID=A0A9N7RJP8_STRHE|nr:DNA-binding bromodomain-containing protein [Striga hermonthica]
MLCWKIRDKYSMEIGIRRRSPRISASTVNYQLSTIHKRKRKFGDSNVSKLAKQVWKGRCNPEEAHDYRSTDSVEWRSTGDSSQTTIQKHDDKAPIMPDKPALELVLDTLQRRDNYEIFAEPVDPDEVEDYYEIIKEPMDFGTMRAKLHEGMYKSLEQFEHDLFLIPENAMHFNSSATVYFKQARVLHELAKKVFDALKADPKSFVSKFSGTRRRSMRKALMNRSNDKKTCLKDTKTHRNVFSKCNSNRNYNPSVISHPSNNKEGRDGRLAESAILSFKPRQTHDCGSSSSLYNLLQHNSTPSLVMMRNGGEYSYKDSLMSFVKDLGPTAQMVAKRKLLGDSSNNVRVELSSTSIAPIQKKPDAHLSDQVSLFKTFRDFASTAGNKSNPLLYLHKNLVFASTQNIQNDARNAGEKVKSSRGHDFGVKQIAKKDVPSNNIRSSDDNVRPVILALENYCHSNTANAMDFKLRNKRMLTTAGDEQQRKKPSSNSFTFDLSFLRARLNQMKAPPSLPSPSLYRGGGFNLAIGSPIPDNRLFNSHLPLRLL